ncbi:MAG: APC family permease [Leptospirales bacterium]
MSSGALRREGGPIGLLYASLGAIIGSGWLFGPLNAAREAGPLSLGSWGIGALSILLLGSVFAELGPLAPRSGAIVHLSHVGNGPLLGKVWGWILFFSYVSVPPVEVMAILAYANNYLPGYVDPVSGLLTARGFGMAILLLGAVTLSNFLVIRLVLLVNSAATWWKLLVPFATIFLLLHLSYHPENLSVSAPGGTLEGMFAAVGSAGVIFSFFGFRQAVDLAGETKSPGRNLPLAVIGSVVVGSLLYLGLQAAFLLAVDPKDLARGGWSHLSFSGVTGPFAALAVSLGALWWGAVLYADALVSPGGTAFIYLTSASRIAMAQAETGSAPRFLGAVNARGVPWTGLLFSWGVGSLFFFPFPSWHRLVAYISSVTVLSYCLGPVILLQLRRAMPHAPRPFRLKGAGFFAPLAFAVSNWIVFWAGFETLRVTVLALAVLVGIYLAGRLLPPKRRSPGALFRELGIAHSWWVLPYFAGMWTLSFLGPKKLGGTGTIPFFADMGLVAIGSLLVLRMALSATVPVSESVRIMESLAERPPAAP